MSSIIGKLNGKKLSVEIELCERKDSSTGKSEIVASSQGFQATAANIDGKPIKVNLTAIIAK